MTETKIVTNNVPRNVLYWWDLSTKEQKEFDYLDSEDRQSGTSFVRYRGAVYDLGEFMAVDKRSHGGSGGNGAFHKWDGYHSDSYFSAVLVRYVGTDCEQVIMGTALS